MMEISKNYAAIRISGEDFYTRKSFTDRRYDRRVERVIKTPPTESEWADYRKAKEAHDYLLNSPYFQDGGPDERSEVTEPETRREYIYAETVEAWIARCREIDKEDAE